MAMANRRKPYHDIVCILLGLNLGSLLRGAREIEHGVISGSTLPSVANSRTFHWLEVRLGGKKAAVAVAHKLLVIVYHLLHEGTY